MNLESIIRERAEVLAYEAERYPATAHVAQTWLVNALRWACRRNNDDLVEHLRQRIAWLSLHRWERLLAPNTQAIAA